MFAADVAEVGETRHHRLLPLGSQVLVFTELFLASLFLDVAALLRVFSPERQLAVQL